MGPPQSPREAAIGPARGGALPASDALAYRRAHEAEVVLWTGVGHGLALAAHLALRGA